jgi:predicted RNA methylase
MLSYASLRGVVRESVADFAVGDGSLLTAAKERWPVVSVIATDIDFRKIRSLKKNNPEWVTGVCDFLNARSRRNCKALFDIADGISLILLNPPFSNRGGKSYEVIIDGALVCCSAGMAFLICALPLLSKEGEVISILPMGCITGERDVCAWNLLREKYTCETLDINGHRTFAQCSARTAIVRLRRLEKQGLLPNPSPQNGHADIELGNTIVVLRGNVSMHRLGDALAGRLLPLVHTTELRDHKIQTWKRGVRGVRATVGGPGIMIPRVGQPSLKKICLYLSHEPLVISDCVFYVPCGSKRSAKRVFDIMLRKWPEIERAYGGTCARYMTLRGLKKLLTDLGIAELLTPNALR